MNQRNSKAVELALQHAEAWSNHDWDTAQAMLAPDVHVKTMTTQPIAKDVDTTGSAEYMKGLKDYAQATQKGSLNILSTIGDDTNSLIMLTVEADFGHGKVTVPAARLALWDEQGKLKSEQVIFFALSK